MVPGLDDHERGSLLRAVGCNDADPVSEKLCSPSSSKGKSRPRVGWLYERCAFPLEEISVYSSIGPSGVMMIYVIV